MLKFLVLLVRLRYRLSVAVCRFLGYLDPRVERLEELEEELAWLTNSLVDAMECSVEKVTDDLAEAGLPAVLSLDSRADWIGLRLVIVEAQVRFLRWELETLRHDEFVAF